MAAFEDLPLGVAGCRRCDQQALVRAVVVELPQGVVDLAAGDPQAEVVARHRLDHVGLVENHDVVLGQQAHPFAAAGPDR